MNEQNSSSQLRSEANSTWVASPEAQRRLFNLEEAALDSPQAVDVVDVRVTSYGEGEVAVAGILHTVRRRPPARCQVRKTGDRELADQQTMWECAARASRNVRERVLMLKADTLLTFTARGGLSRAEVWHALAEYRDTYPEGYLRDGYVAVPELHHGEGANSGKYHAHVAVPKGGRFVDYAGETHRWSETLRRLHPGRWGADETCGTVNVRECGRTHKWPRAKIAWYLTKYITKDIMEGTLNCKRYACSKGIPRPDVARVRITRHEGGNLTALVLAIAQALTGLTPTQPQTHDLPGRIVVSTVAMNWDGRERTSAGSSTGGAADGAYPATISGVGLLALTQRLSAAAVAPELARLIEAATTRTNWSREGRANVDPHDGLSTEAQYVVELANPWELTAAVAELERRARLKYQFSGWT